MENEHKEDDNQVSETKGRQWCGFSDNTDCFLTMISTIISCTVFVKQESLFRYCRGIMPITSARQMKRSCELSGTVFPRRFQAILDRFGDSPKAMEQAGIAYATDQIIDLLANGVKNIHIYSMNRPEVAAAIMHNISEIIQC